ncbi:hypothetical protein BGW80DRAFT_788747 [Lactifluus volemus]|nr:hypothetical protein BGW80DRAFT_788747 [Lactifluus volemus]
MDDTMSSPLRSAPAPQRTTPASQRLSRKRLAAPFRSPLQTETTSIQPVTRALSSRNAQEPETKRKRTLNVVKETCIRASKLLERSFFLRGQQRNSDPLL